MCMIDKFLRKLVNTKGSQKVVRKCSSKSVRTIYGQWLSLAQTARESRIGIIHR